MAFTWKEPLEGIIYQEVVDEIKDNVDYLWDNVACITHDTADEASQNYTDNGRDHSDDPNYGYDGDNGN